MSFCIDYPLLSPLLDTIMFQDLVLTQMYHFDLASTTSYIYRCFSYIYMEMCLFDVGVGLYV